MWTCHRCQKRLGAFLDGELSTRERASVERHLRMCDSCRARLKDLRDVDLFLHTLDVALPPATLTSRILAAAYERKTSVEKKPTGFWRKAGMPEFWVLKGATAAALIVGLTMGAYMGWTSYWDAGLARSSTSAAENEAIDGDVYALDVLSAAPRGSIEAATLELLGDGR